MNIKVIVKSPMKKARYVYVPDTADSFSGLLGGSAEKARIASDCCILYGRSDGKAELPYNCRICGNDFFGTIVLCGEREGALSGFPLSLRTAKKLFPALKGT
ncbi:MAG: hypothetical protein IJ038_02810 [Clostridia bacterium]|nr:hypothetical protein [Clostridia bacterium]